MTVNFRRITQVVLLSFLLLFLFLCGCDYGRMSEQESIRTYEIALPEMPKGTIPVGGGSEVLQKGNPEDLRNPLAANEEEIDRGKDGYGYFCLMCHGLGADGNGTVGQSFYPLPTNLKGPYVQNQSDGALFHKISFGFRRHPPLTYTIAEEDRWAIILYIRSLKKNKVN